MGDGGTARPVRIELGCGGAVHPGFLGLDRFPLPGVAVVGDLDRPPLPFRDDCADLILAYQSLEHVHDLPGLLEDVWRIARPGAQVVVFAPYGASQLNLANPFHVQHFNEHSPRFWTHAARTSIDPREFSCPPLGSAWGLSRSDNREARLDLRCVRMEFLYFDQYRDLPPTLQRRLRKTRLDVCAQILYCLLVVKAPMTEADVSSASARLRPFMPKYVESRMGPRRLGPWGRLGVWARTARLWLGS